MTSKNLFFKLMKEDGKRRIWAVALASLGFFFFYPVVAAFMAGEIKSYSDYAQGLIKYNKQLSNWLSFHCGMTVFLMMVSSLICGLSSFSFLSSKSKVDFYHGIPVRREKLYVANFLNGILILAVPYGICLALAVAVGIVNGGDPGALCQVAVSSYFLHLTYYVLCYSVVVVASMLTGHLVVCFLGAIVLTFYVPMAIMLANAYYEVFFWTFESNNGIWAQGMRISPVVEYIYQVVQHAQGTLSVWDACKAWAVSLLLAASGCFLYRKRPSEAAGKAMAFSVSRPIIRILLAVLSALGLGIFFWSIRNSMGWAIFGILCGGAICHCVVEIIYHFDFKKLFSHKLQLVFCLALSCGVLVVFRYDLLGYDRYLPQASQVKEASVCVDTLNQWVSYGSTQLGKDGEYTWEGESSWGYAQDYMHYQDVENLLDIATEGVRQTEEKRRMYHSQNRYDYRPAMDEGQESWMGSQVKICYVMNSGRKVYRSYYIQFDDSLRPAMERLYSNGQYQRGTFPVLDLTADQVAAIRYRGQHNKEIYLGRLTDAEKKRFLETFQREFARLDMETMRQEAPVGLIRFAGVLDEEAKQKERERDKVEDFYSQYEYNESGGYYEYATVYSRYSIEDFYPIYPSFTGTLECLKERGIQAEYIDSLDVREVHIYCDAWGTKYATDDPQEIEKLKKVLVAERLLYYNPVFQKENLEVGMMVPEKYEGGTRADTEDIEYRNLPAAIPKGKIPAEVQKALEQ